MFWCETLFPNRYGFVKEVIDKYKVWMIQSEMHCSNSKLCSSLGSKKSVSTINASHITGMKSGTGPKPNPQTLTPNPQPPTPNPQPPTPYPWIHQCTWLLMKCVVPENIHTPPMEKNYRKTPLPPGFSKSLHGGGMDIFWNYTIMEISKTRLLSLFRCTRVC